MFNKIIINLIIPVILSITFSSVCLSGGTWGGLDHLSDEEVAVLKAIPLSYTYESISLIKPEVTLYVDRDNKKKADFIVYKNDVKLLNDGNQSNTEQCELHDYLGKYHKKWICGLNELRPILRPLALTHKATWTTNQQTPEIFFENNPENRNAFKLFWNKKLDTLSQSILLNLNNFKTLESFILSSEMIQALSLARKKLVPF